jgi:MFS-type transporter involved in bile tolerance (Atg22 family)
MSPSNNQPEKNRAQYAFNLTLAAVAGQVGCLTLLIVIAALFGGLWLDSRFQTRPMFTVGLMVLSVPITLVVMFWVVRTTTSRLQAKTEKDTENLQEEVQGGE